MLGSLSHRGALAQAKHLFFGPKLFLKLICGSGSTHNTTSGTTTQQAVQQHNNKQQHNSSTTNNSKHHHHHHHPRRCRCLERRLGPALSWCWRLVRCLVNWRAEQVALGPEPCAACALSVVLVRSCAVVVVGYLCCAMLSVILPFQSSSMSFRSSQQPA